MLVRLAKVNATSLDSRMIDSKGGIPRAPPDWAYGFNIFGVNVCEVNEVMYRRQVVFGFAARSFTN